MTPLILDCDTGTDDAVAILLAALHPDLELLGVTTVWGNHSVAHTTDNSLRVLDLVGRGDVGVHPGVDGPGRTDLPPTLDLPAPRSRASGPAVAWLVETLRASARPVTLVTTGPLSNLAAALAAEPRITEAVDRLVVLGGAHRQAGVTPHAERNVWCDPHAAHAVLGAAFDDVLLVTMDATFSAPLTAADAERLRALGTVAATTAAGFVDARIEWYRRDPEMAALGAAPLHDPLAVACLVDPAVVEVRDAAVEVERDDPTTYGATRLTFGGDRGPRPVRVALSADRDRLLEVLCSTLGRDPAIR